MVLSVTVDAQNKASQATNEWFLTAILNFNISIFDFALKVVLISSVVVVKPYSRFKLYSAK